MCGGYPTTKKFQWNFVFWEKEGVCDLDLLKVDSEIWHSMLNICVKFHENEICISREITTSVTNQPTNKLT